MYLPSSGGGANRSTGPACAPSSPALTGYRVADRRRMLSFPSTQFLTCPATRAIISSSTHLPGNTPRMSTTTLPHSPRLHYTSSSLPSHPHCTYRLPTTASHPPCRLPTTASSLFPSQPSSKASWTQRSMRSPHESRKAVRRAGLGGRSQQSCSRRSPRASSANGTSIGSAVRAGRSLRQR